MSSPTEPASCANLNREEDLVLKDLLLQGINSGKISKGRNFEDELLTADLQIELLADLPALSGEAQKDLNRLLSAFPTFSGPYRMARAAQAKISVVHAKTMAYLETLEAQKRQARVAVIVMKEVAAKSEANRLKERERRARSQRQRETGQTSIMSHVIRGPLPRAGPSTSQALTRSKTLHPKTTAKTSTFKTSTPSGVHPSDEEVQIKQEIIVLSSDSSDGAAPSKKAKPRRSPRFEVTEDANNNEQLDGAASSRSSATTSLNPSPQYSSLEFFTNMLGDSVEQAVREVEILREQARRELEVEVAMGHSEAGEHRAEKSDANEYPADKMDNRQDDAVDLTIHKLMWGPCYSARPIF